MQKKLLDNNLRRRNQSNNEPVENFLRGFRSLACLLGTLKPTFECTHKEFLLKARIFSTKQAKRFLSDAPNRLYYYVFVILLLLL
jgi:hypothetical protein